MKAGLLGGAIGAAVGGVSGGLIRGFSDMSKGYNFWNGSRISEFGVGTPPVEDYEKIAKTYNSSMMAESNDEILQLQMKEFYDVQVGDMNIEEITTKSGKKYGMTSKGLYVNSKGALAGGYVFDNSNGHSEVHISPYYSNANLIDFKAVVGHELIHAWHYSLQFSYGAGYNNVFSENMAYKYTVNTYLSAGKFQMATDVAKVAMQLKYWNVSRSYYPLSSKPRLW